MRVLALSWDDLKGFRCDLYFWRGRTNGRTKVFQEVLADLKMIQSHWNFLQRQLWRLTPIPGMPMKIQMSETTAAILEMVCQYGPVSMHWYCFMLADEDYYRSWNRGSVWSCEFNIWDDKVVPFGTNCKWLYQLQLPGWKVQLYTTWWDPTTQGEGKSPPCFIWTVWLSQGGTMATFWLVGRKEEEREA